MEKIAIITDSSCDINDSLLKEYNISLLPLKIIYKDREYNDRVEISVDEVYSRLKDEIPTTSLPSPEYVLNLINRLKDEGYTHILGVTISSGLSGTYNLIRNLCDEIEGIKIEILDSKTLSLGLGLIVLEVAKKVKEGCSFEEAKNVAEKAMGKIDLVYAIKTLEYLRKGGRIGKVEGTVGDLLNIKPIISVNKEGVYYTRTKVRGRKKSITELFNIVKEASENVKMNVAVLHGDAYDECMELKEKISLLPNVTVSLMEQICPVLSVHTGPGLVGVVMQTL